MPTIKLFLFVILTTFFQFSYAQEKSVAASGKTPVIPFELTEHNLIAVKAILNNTDTIKLMFHTAASALALTEESTQKLKSLRFSGTDTVTSWGGGGNAARFSPGNTLQIGDQHWNNISLWEDKNSGHGTDGKFGPDLFANKAVEIDFDKKQILLHTTLPRKTRKYETLNLIRNKDNLFIEASCQTGKETITNRFLLHSGYAGSLLLDDKFVTEHQLGNTLTITGEKQLKDAFGNVLKTKKAILPALLIGKQSLSNVPVGFFEGAIGRQKMSIIGFDILKRFNLIIDAQRTHIYMKANKLTKTAYMNV